MKLKDLNFYFIEFLQKLPILAFYGQNRHFKAFSILMHTWHPDFLSDRFSCVNTCVSMPLSSSFTCFLTQNLQKRRLSQTICTKCVV